MISDFTRKTTVTFDGTVTVDGVATALSVLDVVTLIVKTNYDDTDAEAIITKVATHLEATGGVRFSLTVADTTVDAGDFHSQIKWVHNETDVYILETTRITISKRIFD